MVERIAGPELDAEIARRVFGFTVQRLPDGWWRTAHPGGDIDVSPDGLRSYSTNLADAMAVFEAMVERVGWGTIAADMEDARGQGLPMHVRFGQGPAACNPLPLAICQAALAALGREETPRG